MYFCFVVFIALFLAILGIEKSGVVGTYIIYVYSIFDYCTQNNSTILHSLK